MKRPRHLFATEEAQFEKGMGQVKGVAGSFLAFEHTGTRSTHFLNRTEQEGALFFTRTFAF